MIVTGDDHFKDNHFRTNFSTQPITLFIVEYENSCNAPGSQMCVPLPQCKYAMNLIMQYGIGSPRSREFLDTNRCGFEGRDPKVCCPQEQEPSENYSGQNENQGSDSQKYAEGYYPDATLLSPSNCGISESNRIIGGGETELGEFPWMAVLEYIESEYSHESSEKMNVNQFRMIKSMQKY